MVAAVSTPTLPDETGVFITQENSPRQEGSSAADTVSIVALSVLAETELGPQSKEDLSRKRPRSPESEEELSDSPALPHKKRLRLDAEVSVLTEEEAVLLKQSKEQDLILQSSAQEKKVPNEQPEMPVTLSIIECKAEMETLMKKIYDQVSPSLGFLDKNLFKAYCKYRLPTHIKKAQTYKDLAELTEWYRDYFKNPAHTKNVKTETVDEVLKEIAELIGKIRWMVK